MACKATQEVSAMTIEKGPYDGFWIKDGEKVVAWFADEEPAKKYKDALEGK